MIITSLITSAFGSSFKPYLWLLCGSLVAWGYVSYNNTLTELETAKNALQAITRAYEYSETARVEFERSTKANQVLVDQLNTKLANHGKNISELRSLLSKHNLTKLAHAKPEMIERRINDASAEIFADIAAITRD